VIPVLAEEVLQDLEGIGPTRGYAVDLVELNGSTLARLGKTLSVAGAGAPYMLGLRRRRATSEV
jgi:hypothetical protein